MLHPSYTDLMKVVNSETAEGEQPMVQSRYSIVIATAKRARQIIAGDEPMVPGRDRKPLSMAIDELNTGKVKIISADGSDEDDEKILEFANATDVFNMPLDINEEEIFQDHRDDFKEEGEEELDFEE